MLGYRGMEEEGNRFLGWIVREGQVGKKRASEEREKKSRLMSRVEIRRKEGVRLVGRIRAVGIEGREVQQHSEGKMEKVILTC